MANFPYFQEIAKHFVLHADQSVSFRNASVAVLYMGRPTGESRSGCHGNECMWHTWFWACIHSNKMAFCNEPSNEICRKWLATAGETMINQCTTALRVIKWCWFMFKLDLKGQGSPELALEERKKERKKEWQFAIFINSWFRHTQSFSWTFLVLIDRKFAGDSDCES